MRTAAQLSPSQRRAIRWNDPSPAPPSPKPDAPKFYHPLPASKSQVLIKRANSKVISDALARQLIALNSPMKKMYERQLRCCEVLTKEGKKFKSTYCGCKTCLQCNRI